MDPQIKKIPQLFGATGLSPEDLLVVNQVIGGVNKTRKLPLGTLEEYFGPGSGLEGATGATGPIGATGPAGDGSAITVAPNSGLVLASGQLSTLYNTAISDEVLSIALGGADATAAALWKTKSLVAALDALLFPDINPTYTTPSIVLTATQSGTREVGTQISQFLTLTATENDAGAFSYLSINKEGSSIYNSNSLTAQAAVDVEDQFGYTNPNNPNNKYVITYTDNFTAPVGSLTWSGTGNYAAGLTKKNNKNVSDTRLSQIRSTSAPQAASTGFTSNSIVLTSIYPFFWGVSSVNLTNAEIAAIIEDGLANKELLSAGGDVEVTYDASAEYVWVAIQEDYPLKTKWYNTALNNGNIGAGQFILSPTSYSVNSPDDYWFGVGYKIYISSGATNTEGSLIFKN